MRRRTFLLGTAAMLPALAGCSGGSTDDGGAFGGDGTGSDGSDGGTGGVAEATRTDYQFDTTTTAVPTTTTPPPARGSITGAVTNEGFEAVDLAGAIDPGARTIEMQVTLRNTGDSVVIVYALAYNFYDGAGGRLAGARKTLESERELAPGAAVGLTQTVEFGDKTDPSEAATVEVFVDSRSP